jgi:hypothetical protein
LAQWPVWMKVISREDWEKKGEVTFLTKRQKFLICGMIVDAEQGYTPEWDEKAKQEMNALKKQFWASVKDCIGNIED